MPAEGCLGRSWPRWPLLNVWADDLSMAQLLEELDRHGGVVYTVNPDHLYHLQYQQAFFEAYRQADYITVDSHYVRLALCGMGRRTRHRVPGSDLVPAYLHHRARQGGGKVFLLGAKPGVAQRAMARINQRVGQTLVVGALGPSMDFVNDSAEIEAAIAHINASGADTLLVGLGAPKQEMWIAAHRQRMPHVRVIMGIGATIDYEAGEVKRAPLYLQRCGLEWAYRVCTEPGRYLLRYLRNTRFVWWSVQDALGWYVNPFEKPPVRRP